jgi:hypothetical protein
LWTRLGFRGVAGNRAETAAKSPSCPSGTPRSISPTPRLRRSCRRQLQPSLSSSAHARKASTSLLPSRSTPSAVRIMVAAVCVPCRTVKWMGVLRRECGNGGASDTRATLHTARRAAWLSRLTALALLATPSSFSATLPTCLRTGEASKHVGQGFRHLGFIARIALKHLRVKGSGAVSGHASGPQCAPWESKGSRVEEPLR